MVISLVRTRLKAPFTRAIFTEIIKCKWFPHANFVLNSGARLKGDEIEMYCDMNKKECFLKCFETKECLSFTVGMNESCVGAFCLLHSMSKIRHSHLLEEENSVYHFMVRCESIG